MKKEELEQLVYWDAVDGCGHKWPFLVAVGQPPKVMSRHHAHADAVASSGDSGGVVIDVFAEDRALYREWLAGRTALEEIAEEEAK